LLPIGLGINAHPAIRTPIFVTGQKILKK